MKQSIVCRHYDVHMVPIQCTSCGGSFLVCPKCSPGRVCPDCEGKTKPVSPREKEVLEMIVRGLTNKEISLVLGISLATVRNHTHSIFEKMGASNRTEAAVTALENGLVNAPKKSDSEKEEDETKRDKEILEMIVNGLGSKEIALSLGVTFNTARHYTSSVFEKMGVKNRTEAAVEAIKRGLVPMPEKLGSEEGGSK